MRKPLGEETTRIIPASETNDLNKTGMNHFTVVHRNAHVFLT